MKEKNPYPALLWLQGKKACVVGGGRVALHRVEGLLNAGVEVEMWNALRVQAASNGSINAFPPR